MKFSVYLSAMGSTTIGIIISTYLITIIDLPEIITAIFWFLITYIAFVFARKVKDYAWFKILSLDFFLTWAFVCIGVILGVVIVDLILTKSVTLNLDEIQNVFFQYLPLALAPTLATSLGLRE